MKKNSSCLLKDAIFRWQFLRRTQLGFSPTQYKQTFGKHLTRKKSVQLFQLVATWKLNLFQLYEIRYAFRCGLFFKLSKLIPLNNMWNFILIALLLIILEKNLALPIGRNFSQMGKILRSLAKRAANDNHSNSNAYVALKMRHRKHLKCRGRIGGPIILTGWKNCTLL